MGRVISDYIMADWEKCEMCFWNYNCAYYGGMNEDEWSEEAVEDFKNCNRWKE